MLIFVYSALIVVFDQLFKQWIILTHSVGQETVLIPGFFSLFRLHNPGAAFGFMAGLPWWVLAAVQLIAVVILVMIILRYTEGFWGSLGLASVLGGAVGNLVDRIMHQYVVDMFRFTFIDFAIFNLADVFISMGFLIFLCHYIAQTFKSDKSKKALADSDDMDYDEYDQLETPIEAVHDGLPVDAQIPAPAPIDFEALAQIDPAVYDTPVAELTADGQVAVQPIPQPMPPPIPPPPVLQQPVPQPVQQPIPQPAPQPVPQPAPQAVLPLQQPIAHDAVPPPAPQPVVAQQSDMAQPIAPAAMPQTIPSAEAAKPLLDPSSHTGPLPAVEIAPLLDHVYGGQYLQKQEAAAQQPLVPTAPPAPMAPPAAPVMPTAPTAQPAPIAQPAPVAPTAPVVDPVPVVEPAVPAVSLTEHPASATEIPLATDTSETMLDALTALESELLGENALDDYNADKLLGEYGFESETKD